MKAPKHQAPAAPEKSELEAALNVAGDRALEFLRRLVNGAEWYSAAIELGYSPEVNAYLEGGDLRAEALDILRQAGVLQG
jgi:hypothetical protein